MSDNPWLNDYLTSPPAQKGWRRRGNWPNTRTYSATSTGTVDTRRKNLLPQNRPWGTASAEGPIQRGAGTGGGGGAWGSPSPVGTTRKSKTTVVRTQGPPKGRGPSMVGTRQSSESLVATRVDTEPRPIPPATLPAEYRRSTAAGTGTGRSKVATRVTDSQQGLWDPPAREWTSQQLRMHHAFEDWFQPDKETGGFVDVLAGQAIGGGTTTGAADAARGGLATFNKSNPVSSFQGMSVKAAAGFLFGMNDDELIALQTQLANAGFYKNTPMWGVLDNETTTAFADFVHAGLTVRPGETVNDMMAKRTKAHLSGMDTESALDGTDGTSRKGPWDPSTDLSVLNALQQDNVTVTSSATLAEAIDTVAVELMGMKLPASKRDQIVDLLQSRERQHYYATVGAKRQSDLDNLMASKAKPLGPTGQSELDAFARVIGTRESNNNPEAYNSDSGAWGKYQFMYWNEWAREAGVDPADRSEANQDRVAKYKMAQYYANYGNWRDVAIAWYAGGGTLARMKAGEVSGNGSEGDYPTINTYADDTMAALNAQLGQGSVSPNNGGLSYRVPDPKFVEDPTSDQEIRRMVRNADPSGFAASQFRDRAYAFFDMLGPVVNYGF